MTGYVYLIGTPIFRWYKIGKSKSPEVRIGSLGILLPFRVEVIGIWKAENHSLLESLLHQKYVERRINGEWFEFSKAEVAELFNYIPDAARVFPVSDNPDSVFAKFSNIEQDTRDGKRILSVRVEKLRGNFTPEEREAKRLAAIAAQKARKLINQHP